MNGKQGFNVRQALWLYVMAGVLILIAVVATIAWLGPLPPKVVTMSTGTAGSDFDQFGRAYQALLKRSGVQLRLVPSAGSVENIARLNDSGSSPAISTPISRKTPCRAP